MSSTNLTGSGAGAMPKILKDINERINRAAADDEAKKAAAAERKAAKKAAAQQAATDPAPLLNVEPAKTTTATITSSATLSAVVAANEPAQAKPVQAAARPTPVQSAPAPSADSGKGLHIDTESREILRYISQDYVLLGALGKEVAYHIESGDVLNQKFFAKFCSKHYGDVTIITADGKEERQSSGAVWWTWNDPMQRVARRLVMEPTSKSEEEDNPEVFNLWHERRKSMAVPNLDATIESIKPFIDHLMYLADGDQVVVMFFMNWLATLYQRPEIKIPSAILLYSKIGGVGKSMLWGLLAAVFAKSMVGNCSGRALTKSFDDVTEHKRLLVINEVARSEKADGYENFKNMISEEQTSFEGKGRAAKDIRNITHFIVTTNNLDALPLMQGDRRIAVFMCNAAPKSDDYYRELGAWMDGPGPSLLAGVLANWVFPVGWNPRAPVPQTAAARAMQDAAQGESFGLIKELIEEKRPPFDKDFVEVVPATKAFNTEYASVLKRPVTKDAMADALQAICGDKRRCRIRMPGAKDDTNPWLYFIRDSEFWRSRSPLDRGEYLTTGKRAFPVRNQSGEVANHE